MANGQETGIETLRGVIAHQARGHDWNSIREFHQGQRSTTALKGRIHDRTPTRLPRHQKALAESGPSIHDERWVWRNEPEGSGSWFWRNEPEDCGSSFWRNEPKTPKRPFRC